MSTAFSIYLDLVRFLAACLVYMYHSNQRFVVTEILPFSKYGHSAVIVFFVLSGYVIAYVSDTKEREWITYSASRLSRVYSVALPAVILTLLLDSSGRTLMPEIYSSYPYDQFLLRTLASLLFSNEVWFISITAFSNIAYWSVCYELWYYVFFGLLVFAPRRTGLLCAVLLGLALGPKIMLLAPIWGLGVLLYRWQALTKLSIGSAWWLLTASTAAIIWFHSADIAARTTEWLRTIIGPENVLQLTHSKYFLSDILLGILVATNFTAMRKVVLLIAPLLLAIKRPVRFLASYTFSLYLLHEPLFAFWAATLHGDPSNLGYWLATTSLVAASVVVIGYFTENKRDILRVWFEYILQRVSVWQRTAVNVR
jgi:peptidoglycan/LPS O-acetylase OafA/YrhL